MHHGSCYPDCRCSYPSGSRYRPAGRYPHMDNLPLLPAAKRISFQVIIKLLSYIIKQKFDIVKQIVELESELSQNKEDLDVLKRAKRYGYSDYTIAKLWGTTEDEVRNLRKEHKLLPVYKMVDTCAAEFDSSTPYFYSSYDLENESKKSNKAIKVSYKNFDHLGLWTKPQGAPFICIEPWKGLADKKDVHVDFSQKDGNNCLKPSETFCTFFR